MDTTIVNFIQDPQQIVIQQELCKQAIEISKELSHKQEHFNYTVLIPLVAAFAAALTTIGGQWFIKWVDKQKELKAERKEIISTCMQLQTQLLFYLKDLAYFKINTEIQLINHQTEEDPQMSAKFLEEHYNASANIWESEKMIASTISLFVAQMVKFQINSQSKISFNNDIQTIQHIRFGPTGDYNTDSDISDAQVLYDVSVLTTQYIIQIAPLQTVIAAMMKFE